MTRFLAVILAIAILPVGLAGCGGRDTEVADDGATTIEEAAPSDVPEATDGTTTAGADSIDTDALLDELDAIEKELSGASLPDDSDFSEIEEGL